MKLSLIPNSNYVNKKPLNNFNTFSKFSKIENTTKKQLNDKISKTTTLIPGEGHNFKYNSWNNTNEFVNPNEIVRHHINLLLEEKKEKVFFIFKSRNQLL